MESQKSEVRGQQGHRTSEGSGRTLALQPLGSGCCPEASVSLSALVDMWPPPLCLLCPYEDPSRAGRRLTAVQHNLVLTRVRKDGVQGKSHLRLWVDVLGDPVQPGSCFTGCFRLSLPILQTPSAPPWGTLSPSGDSEPGASSKTPSEARCQATRGTVAIGSPRRPPEEPLSRGEGTPARGPCAWASPLTSSLCFASRDEQKREGLVHSSHVSEELTLTTE